MEEAHGHDGAENPTHVTDDVNYAKSIPSTENHQNGAESGGDTQQPAIDPEPIYLEIHESPATSISVVEQALQTSVPPVPDLVSQIPTTNDNSNTIQSPTATNHGYSPQLTPPDNNAGHNIPDTREGGNVSTPQVHNLPTSRSDFIYLEGQPAPSSTVGEQTPQAPVPTATSVVPENLTANEYSRTMEEPSAINHNSNDITGTQGGGNVSTPSGPQVHQLPTTSDFIYLEGPPATSATVVEQALQAPTLTDTSIAPQNPTTNEYLNPTHPPTAINRGALPQQIPPSYNAAQDTRDTWGLGNSTAPSRSPVYHYPNVAPHNQTIDINTNATQAPFVINHGYVPEQQPPPYDNLHAKGNLGFSPGPPVYQQQPWNQPPAPYMTTNVVINSQPQPMSPNVVILNNPPPERNSSQGLATTSQVMAIVGIFFCFPSIICAIVGLVFAAISLGSSTDPNKAKTYANISMVFTVIGWVMGVSLLIVLFSAI